MVWPCAQSLIAPRVNSILPQRRVAGEGLVHVLSTCVGMPVSVVRELNVSIA
jgi:hypothetical protein